MATRSSRGPEFRLAGRLGAFILLAASTAYALFEDPKEARRYRADEDEHALVAQPTSPLELRERTGIDPTSHLEWVRQSPPDHLTWEKAKEHCASIADDGGGFRLPSRDELLTLLGKSEDPFEANIDWYWSSTPGVRADTAWAVGAGAWLNGNPTTTRSRVRCVRNARR